MRRSIILTLFVLALLPLAPSADAQGIITTVAGNGSFGFNGDGIPATSAMLAFPRHAVSDGAGNVFIVDQFNHSIRRVDAGTGLISTVAGTGVSGYNGDGIPATTAQLFHPLMVALDGAGNVYIADQNNFRIRRVDAGTGLISTVAGNGGFTFNGEGIPATSAEISAPRGLAFDAGGNLFIATNRDRVRRVDAGTGLINTVAGTGVSGYNGDGIPATTAQLRSPHGLAVDTAGNVFIVDTANQRVRRVDAGTGLISTGGGHWRFALPTGMGFPRFPQTCLLPLG